MKSRSPVRAAAVATLGALAACETAPGTAKSSSAGPAPLGAETPASRRLSGETFDVSKLDQKPVPVFMARPNYPRAQRDAKVAGEAVVDFIVDPDGNVRNAFALRATHADFGKAAVEAVERWKFQPGRKGGREVNTHMQVPIVFTLDAK